MATNQYLPWSSNVTAERTLTDDLIVEAIQIYGIDVHIIKRTLVKEDFLFGEDVLNKFENYITIEAYVDSIDGFGGEGDIIKKLGFEMRDTLSLIISKTRYETLGTVAGFDDLKPREGDLVYFPLNKGLFEIKFVENEDPFYQLGHRYVYKLNLELYQYTHEDVNTGISSVDTVENMFENNNDPGNEPYAHNEEIQSEADDIINFDETNPFGEP